MKSRKVMLKYVKPLKIVLVVALLIFIASFFSGKELYNKVIHSIAGNDRFIYTALALELGVRNKETTVYNPNSNIIIKSDDTDVEKEQVIENENKTNIAELTVKPNAMNKADSKEHAVYVNNDAKAAFNLEDMLKNPFKIQLNNKQPEVLLIHTHGSESYTPDDENMYSPDDNDRTLDKNLNIIRVGNEIEAVLKENGINTIHIEDIFDHPTYSGSYTRALDAIKATMKKNPSIKIVIDIHRDAMITANGTKYKTVSEVNGEKIAQLMFVVGSNVGGLTHDNWKNNLNFVVNLQNKINEKYTTLMRPIHLRKERFNQHATPGSMLLEVGTSGNTLGEALAAARIFAQELSDTLK